MTQLRWLVIKKNGKRKAILQYMDEKGSWANVPRTSATDSLKTLPVSWYRYADKCVLCSNNTTSFVMKHLSETHSVELTFWEGSCNHGRFPNEFRARKAIGLDIKLLWIVKNGKRRLEYRVGDTWVRVPVIKKEESCLKE